MSLLPLLGKIRSGARRLISVLRAIPVGLSRLVKSEKSNSFLNIRLLIVLTLETAIYLNPSVNSLEVILITALLSVIPYALCTIITNAIRIGNCLR